MQNDSTRIEQRHNANNAADMRNGNMHTAHMAQNCVTGGQLHAYEVAKYVLVRTVRTNLRAK